ncbi:MAG: anaerobic ribonucleoside-triphosphate reductase activating protein [Candidatus Micrarchaeota archaeon]|nr:anaerobic ribonucleoside-triphosphate reductase activating protein [Candidatus Micrarchaeota archaeon]
MKIGGFQKTSLVDFPGRVAAIVFTSGCNMRCGYCYNAPLATGKVPDLGADAVFSEILERKKYVDAVVITGGEPTIWPDLPDRMRTLKAAGFFVKLDTNGLNPEKLRKILGEGLADYVAMDVKAPWAKYGAACGVPGVNEQKLHESIGIIKDLAPDYEFRTTVFPGLVQNDLRQIAHMLVPAKRWFLQPFLKTDSLMDPAIVQKPLLTALQIQQVVAEFQGTFDECRWRGD